MVDPRLWGIRDAEEGDLPFLRALYGSTRQDLGLLPQDLRDSLIELQFQAQRRGYAASYPQARQEIIEVGAAGVGHLLTAEQANELVLVDFGLQPEWRGQGIGGAALRLLQARAWAAAQGMRLQVTRGNPAVHLYTRHSFVISAEDEVRLTMRWTGDTRQEGDPSAL